MTANCKGSHKRRRQHQQASRRQCALCIHESTIRTLSNVWTIEKGQGGRAHAHTGERGAGKATKGTHPLFVSFFFLSVPSRCSLGRAFVSCSSRRSCRSMQRGAYCGYVSQNSLWRLVSRGLASLTLGDRQCEFRISRRFLTQGYPKFFR